MILSFSFTDWKTQNKNEEEFEKSENNFKVGQLVYCDKKVEIFDKSFFSQRGELFRVRKVDAKVFPVLFYVEDLQGYNVKKPYYKEQLRSGPSSLDDPSFVFEIEKILKERKRKNGEKEYFVKYLYYPKKFNEWIKEDQIKIDNRK